MYRNPDPLVGATGLGTTFSWSTKEQSCPLEHSALSITFQREIKSLNGFASFSWTTLGTGIMESKKRKLEDYDGPPQDSGVFRCSFNNLQQCPEMAQEYISGTKAKTNQHQLILLHSSPSLQ